MRKRPIKTYQRVKLWRKKNPEKIKAQRIVFAAVRNGTLKKEKCFCGENKTQTHHEDYGKPLDVIWLCKRHHMEFDIERRGKS